MKRLLSVAAVFGLVAALALPTVSAAKGSNRSIKALLNPTAIDKKADANTIGKFNRVKENKKLWHVNGRVTAVSATSISVAVTTLDNANGNANATLTTTTYTFAVNDRTIVIRKFKGKSAIHEVAVGDRVMIWATSLTDGTARLIWDKSIWLVSLNGKITNLNADAKTFTLVVTRKGVEYSTPVKTDDQTVYLMGDTAKTFADLANDQRVTVRGSWNSVGKYTLALKVTVQP